MITRFQYYHQRLKENPEKYQAHLKRKREKNAQWRKENREKHLETLKAYRQAHIEQHRAYARALYHRRKHDPVWKEKKRQDAKAYLERVRRLRPDFYQHLITKKKEAIKRGRLRKKALASQPLPLIVESPPFYLEGEYENATSPHY